MAYSSDQMKPTIVITMGDPSGIGYYMKSPPKQMRDSVACELTEAFIQGGYAGGDASMEDARTIAGE